MNSFQQNKIRCESRNDTIWITICLALKSDKIIVNQWKCSIPCRNAGRWSNIRTTPTAPVVVKVTFVMTVVIATLQTVNCFVYCEILIYNSFFFFRWKWKMLICWFLCYFNIYCWMKSKTKHSKQYLFLVPVKWLILYKFLLC